MKKELYKLSKEELVEYIQDLSKNWLAHDGLWFQAVEKRFDLETAIALDVVTWKIFTVIEAKRIMKRFGIPENGGLEALKRALKYRLYANINLQETKNADEHSFTFQMSDCRVQAARKRKGLSDFPCKEVGVVEYTNFAKTIDPRIETECVACPPDPHPNEFWCCWKFTLKEALSRKPVME